MLSPFRAKPLTRSRIGLAIAVAIISDAVQFSAGPLGWAFFDQAVDVVAMLITSMVIGFHPLLLPTFLVEFIPVVDMLPTWTGCVGAVILLRKRSQTSPPVIPAPTGETPTRAEDPTGSAIDG